MIVRADAGGLGNQTWEIWRHLEPSHTLVVRATPDGRRGYEHPDRYLSEFTTCWHAERANVPPPLLREFAGQVDVVFTVETPYCRHGFDVIRSAGARGVLLANPELYAPNEYGQADQVYVPTPWALRRVPGAKVLPQPVALDRFDHTRRTGAEVFYHPGAPAMLDRNGTELVWSALRHVTQACQVIIRKPGEPAPGSSSGRMWETFMVGQVEVTWISNMERDYFKAIPPATDVLLLPRRYGGLCLPVLEAAAMGVPALMSELDPQTSWPGVVTVPVTGQRMAGMKGGRFPVWSLEPEALAAAIDGLVSRPAKVAQLSDQARAWAEANSWEALAPAWREAVCG